MFLVIKE